jgi:hypothetical protein
VTPSIHQEPSSATAPVTISVAALNMRNNLRPVPASSADPEGGRWQLGCRSSPVPDVGGALLDVVLPLRRDLVLGGDRVDRTGLDARVAINALIAIDLQLLGFGKARLVWCRMDAVDRADLGAARVLDADPGAR